MAVFKIQHITKYQYDAPIKESANQLKVFPLVNDEQEILNHELEITGNPTLNKFVDYWGNSCAFFTILFVEKELVIDSKLIIRIKPRVKLINLPSLKEDWALYKNSHKYDLKFMDYCLTTRIEKSNEIENLVATMQPFQKSPLDTLFEFSHYIFENFQYVKGITTIETTVNEIWEQKKGVCQDFAHFLIYILRSLGMPTRYVSGYVCPNKNGMRGEGATHAWVEAWIPNDGWVGVDPTNDVFTDENYVKLSVGRDFKDCTPVKGSFKGPANESLNVYVSVGYEDGYVFQQHNDVQLPNLSVEIPDAGHLMGQ